MSDDRTEHPTARRLQEARKRGQVVRTREAGQAASLIAATLVLGWMGSSMIERIGSMLARGLERVGQRPTMPMEAGEITAIATDGLMVIGTTAGPIACAAAVTVFALQGAQGGWVFATEALQMNWGRLNPANGIKRLGLSTGGVELLRSLIAVAAIAFLAHRAVMGYLPGSAELSRLAPVTAAASMWHAASSLMTQAAMAVLLLAGADYFAQRYQLHKSLRMTKQEIRDEHRLTEGNPEIKSRVRRIQREIVRRRMLSAIKSATVVITNPTHFAVALDYRRGMSAPVVVAKGQDHLALRIKAIAAGHGVPMVENVQLARALHGSAEIGETIPAALFEAVAEVLAYLIRIKRLVL